MFSDLELNYIKSLINSYYLKGYKYYLCHTVTERYNDYDIKIYLSKQEIIAIDDNIFKFQDTVVISVDSSSRNDTNNASIGYREVLENSNYSGTLNINIAEFIYTNANCNYDISTVIMHPDILKSGVENPDFKTINFMTMFFVVSIFLYLFLKSILRIGR